MRATSGSQDGFTLVEVMISILLVMIAIIGVIGLYRVQTRSSSNSRHVTEATTLANDKLEQLRTVVGDPSALCGAAENNINELAVATGIFTRTCTSALDGSGNWYNLFVKVTWTEENDTTKNATVRGRRAL